MSESASRGIAGTVDVVVIGAGHSGLAMSYLLGQRSLRHVVLERGEVANTWRTERWDSLRLLTPNWMTRLPGYAYQGDDPDGYMSAGEAADFISIMPHIYRHRFLRAPQSPELRGVSHGFRVETSRGDWLCQAVVLATGAFNKPACRAWPRPCQPASNSSRLTPTAIRSNLPLAGVLVVGGVSHGPAIGAGDPAQRPACNARGGRTRSAAARLSRSRYPMVDARDGSIGPAHRGRRRPRPRPKSTVAAACRHTRPRYVDLKPARTGRQNRRAPDGHSRTLRHNFPDRCATSARSPT